MGTSGSFEHEVRKKGKTARDAIMHKGTSVNFSKTLLALSTTIILLSFFKLFA